MFTTERLRLRAYVSTDIDNILSIFNDPLVAMYITEDYIVPRHIGNFDRLMKMVDTSLMYCVIEELDGSSFVGFTNILPLADAKNRNAAFGVALSSKYWGKGYGLEVGNFMVDYAFRGLAMHRVSLTVFGGNDRALALYKKIGFVEEGRHRKIVWIDGSWRDTVFMGILEDEWPALKQKKLEAAK